MSHIDVVRAAFAAYLAQDRAAMDRLLAEDFVFTSPQDDHIGKAAFLEICFPRRTGSGGRRSSMPSRSMMSRSSSGTRTS